MSKKSDEHVLLTPARPRQVSGESPCAACSVREIAVCGALAPGDLKNFGGSMHAIVVSAGAPLVDEGEPERYIFSITAGCLKSFKLLPDGRRQITGFHFPGDFIGLAKSSSYTCSVEAITDSKLCRMDRSELEAYADAIPNLDRRLHDLASEALAEVQGQILLLGRKTAQERVATFLLMLSHRDRERGGKGNPIDVPMSRDDIGDFLGLTTETVSRTFSRLRKSELIGPDKDRRTTILDEEGLMEISEGF